MSTAPACHWAVSCPGNGTQRCKCSLYWEDEESELIMNKKLNDAAVRALTAANFPTRSGLCQMWVRLVVERVYGKKYDAIIHQPSAKEAAEAFERDGRFVVPKSQGSVPGDILYKKTGSGGYGHVGIRVEGNRVAENSSAHIDAPGDHDARGLRTLAEFGHYDVIVRLPEKK